MGRKAWGGKRFPRPGVAKSSKTLDACRSVNQAGLREDEEEESFCRVCFDTGPVWGPVTDSTPFTTAKDKEGLIQPCGCLGSMTYVHPSCLNKWRSLCAGAAKNRCGVCLQPYTYTLSPISRWQQMAYLIPTLLSMLCICLVICSATVMPHWPRMIIGSIALVVLARYQSVTSLVVLLMLSSVLGLYLRGLQLVAQGDTCGRVCLSLSPKHGMHRPCLADGGALGAVLRKQQHSRDHQEQEHGPMQDEQTEWRWPDSSVLEEDLFGAGPCGQDAQWLDEAAGSTPQSAHAAGCPNDTYCDGLSDSAPGLSGYVWPKSIMARWGWM